MILKNKGLNSGSYVWIKTIHMYFSYIHNCFPLSYRERFTVSVRRETKRDGNTAGDNHIINIKPE